MLYINSSVACLKFAPKWSFSYFQPILAAIFVTIATVKVESIPDLYTLAIVLINLQDETSEEQLLIFDLIGGPKWPLYACTPLSPQLDSENIRLLKCTRGHNLVLTLKTNIAHWRGTPPPPTTPMPIPDFGPRHSPARCLLNTVIE